MEGQDQGDELYPIAVLIDELKVRNNQGALLQGITRTFNVWPATDIRHSTTMSFSV
jgi:hypothetical protein